MRRFAGIVALVALVVVGTRSIDRLTDNGADNRWADLGPLLVRGKAVHRDDFAIEGLRGPQQAIVSTQWHLADQCMQDRGFVDRPVDAAYEQALYGGDGSCRWEAARQMGVDLDRHDELLAAIDAMRTQADANFLEDLPFLTHMEWAQCSGEDVRHLVEHLSAAALEPWADPHPCLGHELLAEAAGLRSRHHFAVAVVNQATIDEWTEMVDVEWAYVGS